MTLAPEDQGRFESAFVAMAYLCGRRGPELVAGLPEQLTATQRLVERLSAPEREARARALAAPLATIGEALVARTIR